MAGSASVRLAVIHPEKDRRRAALDCVLVIPRSGLNAFLSNPVTAKCIRGPHTANSAASRHSSPASVSTASLRRSSSTGPSTRSRSKPMSSSSSFLNSSRATSSSWTTSPAPSDARFAALIEAASASLLYLPPYSPDFKAVRQAQSLAAKSRRADHRRPLDRHRQMSRQILSARMRQLLRGHRL
jgi:hypothetical protein